MPLIPFATKSEPDRGYSGERSLNYFVRPTDGLSKAALLGRGGTVAQADVGGPVRAAIDFDGALYVVANGSLQKVVGSTVTVIGAVGSSEQVSMARNNSQIAFIVGNTYFVSDGVTVSSCRTGAIEVPVWVEYLDGYMVVVGEGQGRKDLVTVSSLDDATTFAGLDFASAEDNPDRLLAITRNGSRLLLIGTRTIEEWYNSGDADFPLAPSGRVIEAGCYDARTIAKEDNSVFFLADDKIAHRSSGGVPWVITTRGIEDVLEAGEPHSACVFTERGHKFYALRMTNGPTLVYDITTQLWHERSTGTEGQPWYVTCAAMSGNIERLGTDTGKVVTIDRDTFTDDGATIVAQAIGLPVYNADGVRVSRVHVAFGGGSYSLDRTPQAMLETSRDGHTWSQEKWRDLPKIGQHGKPVEWRALGYFPTRFQVRITITDHIPRDIYGVKYDAG